jgi:hypothetical protein
MRTYKSKGGIKNKTKKNICSPVSKLHKITPSSCMTPESIMELKKIYNSENPDKQIQTNNVSKIIKQLRERYSCNADQCWLNQIKNRKLREAIQKKIFIPEKPKEWKKNSNEWLSNFDILNVLKQYEEAYPFFRFIGPSPIDFDQHINLGLDCVEKELCEFDVNKEKEKGFTQIGIIFNLDKHDEPGSHWVSMYIDINGHCIYFFDSASTDIPSEIQVFVQRMIQAHPEFKFISNSVEHQYGNTECGMYSLYFIIQMLYPKNRPSLFQKRFNTKKNRITDKDVEQYRDVYFL